MAEGDSKNGWWNAPAAKEWACPGCHASSDPETWPEGEVGCEDCGGHDGRQCPGCGEWFDHVWGSTQIAKETEQVEREGKGDATQEGA